MVTNGHYTEHISRFEILSKGITDIYANLQPFSVKLWPKISAYTQVYTAYLLCNSELLCLCTLHYIKCLVPGLQQTGPLSLVNALSYPFLQLTRCSDYA